MKEVVELLGVAVFAVSGVLAAGRKGLDVLGIAVIALVTAIGGGTLRDLLLDRHPIFWIANTTHLWVILGATVVTLGYVRLWIATRRALLVADALGLAFFTIAGVQITEQAGYSDLIALLMGTITGVAGGVFRDVLTAEIPLVMRPGPVCYRCDRRCRELSPAGGVARSRGHGRAGRDGGHCRAAPGGDSLAARAARGPAAGGRGRLTYWPPACTSRIPMQV
jgi:uncharacterized membrane protein YeiH